MSLVALSKTFASATCVLALAAALGGCGVISAADSVVGAAGTAVETSVDVVTAPVDLVVGDDDDDDEKKDD